MTKASHRRGVVSGGVESGGGIRGVLEARVGRASPADTPTPVQIPDSPPLSSSSLIPLLSPHPP
ncbi:hypothetical protein E2C01_098145 [Portunus trituberculatus]|uniref:Uncharacterized protein n=1 Tax=Portunus trituberculatus TaxID=210409 RepID=A0A5B7K6W2_PORTR|nr:hypothetical protein [Portunus trituberculatus]